MKTDALALQAERRILLIRQQRVMLDYDLAALYCVETRALKQAVRRNQDRFPADFMFELAPDEVAALVSQNVIPGRGQLGGARPMAFTEQGVAMLSSVLRSRRAVQVNTAIMRAFVRLREMLLTNADLARKLAALEAKYDSQFKSVFDATHPEVWTWFKEQRHRLEVFPLPKYSPELNAQERLWHYTRRDATRNRFFEKPADLCNSLFWYEMPEGQKQLLKMLIERKEEQFEHCIANHINLVCGFIPILDELLTK
jgi:hypothetical protein